MSARENGTAASAELLDELADAAEAVAADQLELARKARTAGRRRRQGWSLARILDRESEPGMLALLARSARVLNAAMGRFRETLAAGLAAEGHSTRAIAQRFGVSHQRISAIQNRGNEAVGTDAKEAR